MSSTSVRPLLPRAALSLLIVLLAAVPASAVTFELTVSGPSAVRVGETVRFTATGFTPRERITVNLAPTINRGGNCCGIDVVKNARADGDGKAILRWRWPSTYFNGNERVRWANGSRVDVLVLTADFDRGRKVVRVRR